MAGRLACPRNPTRPDCAHRCVRPGHRSIPSAKFRHSGKLSCLVVSNLQPAPRPAPRSRNWFQIRHHQDKSRANEECKLAADIPANDAVPRSRNPTNENLCQFGIPLQPINILANQPPPRRGNDSKRLEFINACLSPCCGYLLRRHHGQLLS